jgi:hypothetical protein
MKKFLSLHPLSFFVTLSYVSVSFRPFPKVTSDERALVHKQVPEFVLTKAEYKIYHTI